MHRHWEKPRATSWLSATSARSATDLPHSTATVASGVRAVAPSSTWCAKSTSIAESRSLSRGDGCWRAQRGALAGTRRCARTARWPPRPSPSTAASNASGAWRRSASARTTERRCAWLEGQARGPLWQAGVGRQARFLRRGKVGIQHALSGLCTKGFPTTRCLATMYILRQGARTNASRKGQISALGGN